MRTPGVKDVSLGPGRAACRAGWILLLFALKAHGALAVAPAPQSGSPGGLASAPTAEQRHLLLQSRKGGAIGDSRTGVAYARGQIIVKFRPGLSQDAHRLLEEHKTFASALADGSGSLDELNGKHRVRAARAVFAQPPASGGGGAQAEQAISPGEVAGRFPRRTRRAPVGARIPDLSSIYVLDLPADSDVEAVSREYAADPHVEYAQPNYIVHVASGPNDLNFSSQGSWGQGYDDLWGVKRVHAPEAWNTTQGQGITVAMVDTGVDDTHPDIAANVVPGWNFVAGTDEVMDDFGHARGRGPRDEHPAVSLGDHRDPTGRISQHLGRPDRLVGLSAIPM